MFFKDCEECYGSDSFMITPENISHLYHYRNDSKRDYLLNDYGQILYSQFQGIHILLWHACTIQSCCHSFVSHSTSQTSGCIRNYIITVVIGLVIAITFCILGGEECPIILWWPGLSEKERMYRHGYIPISDFDDETKCISGNVTLSRRHFVSNTSRCLTSFDWRGENDSSTRTCTVQ